MSGSTHTATYQQFRVNHITIYLMVFTPCVSQYGTSLPDSQPLLLHNAVCEPIIKHKHSKVTKMMRREESEENWRQCLRVTGQWYGSCQVGNKTSSSQGWETHGDLPAHCEYMHATWSHVLHCTTNAPTSLLRMAHSCNILTAYRNINYTFWDSVQTADSFKLANNYWINQHKHHTIRSLLTLKILSTDEACIDVNVWQRHGAQFLKVKV